MMDERRVKWLIEQGESEIIEFKEFEKLENINDSGKKDLAILFTTFANKKGGTILFGVTNDKKFESYNLTNDKYEKFKQQLIQIASMRCKPAIYLESVKRLNAEQNKNILLIEVPRRSGEPHCVDGVFYIRVDSHNIPISDPSKVRELFEEKERKTQEKIIEDEEIELKDIEDIFYFKPCILIGNHKVPYLKIRSKESGCLLFGESFGFSDRAY